jgi:drug/metabolite transporter (DMT)-like permease
MALQDAVVKLLSGDMPLWQLFFLRSALVIPVLAVLIGRRGVERFRPALSRWVLVRSGLIVSMYVWFYAALPVLDLSTVAAVYYTGPLFIVLFSGLILRERVTASQVLAVFVAFCGVLIVLRPAGDGFSPAALIPLVSALCYALAAVTTRGRTQDMDPWTLTLSLNIVFLLVGGAAICALQLLDPPASSYPFLLTAWTPLDTKGIAVICLLAVASIGIQVFLARAYQLGPTTVVAGLDFSYLAFAAVWALLLLGTVPGGPTVTGTVMIGAAGLWGVLRQRQM